MIAKVKKYIEANELLVSGWSNPCPKVIVGLSGGADSVVLLYVLQRLGYNCLAAHCNFHLRGEEALRDETFAGDFARSLNIPFFKQDFDTLSIARERGISVEMAARDLRYEWFEQLRQEQEAAAIAVAHHQDDTIETMLLNLIRGTGIRGLSGIRPKNGHIVRPLLCASKEDILTFAAKKELPFITDSSNLQDEYTRNKIRLSLLPLLQSLNPSIRPALLRTVSHLHETEKIYEQHIREATRQIFNPGTGSIDLNGLQLLPSPEAVLFELLKDYGFNRETVEDIHRAIYSQPGKEFYAPDYVLIRDRQRFLLLPRAQTAIIECYKLHETDTEISFPLSIRIHFEPVDADFEIRKDRQIACLDTGKLQFPLQIRRWRKGDKFVPFGMNNFRKISDYFNDRKFSKPEKENTWLLCSGNDIVWIIGHRTDNRYRITEETRRAMVLELLPAVIKK